MKDAAAIVEGHGKSIGTEGSGRVIERGVVVLVAESVVKNKAGS